MKNINSSNNLRILLFCVLAGTISTLWGYTYGNGNHIEQLPIVLRAIDSSYLVNDFFTNANMMFGPRLYFARFVAGLTVIAPLHIVYLGLTILSNILVALVTAIVAREQFDGSDRAAFLAAAAVMGLKTFWLGSPNTVYRTYLEPLLLVSPLLLGAIWAGMRRRPLIAAMLSGIASLVHSLVGLETGALVLGALVVQVILQGDYKAAIQKQRRYLTSLSVGGVLFSGFAALSLVPYISAERIAPDQFINIMAVFRHPHHYLPSTFGLEQYAQAFIFLLAASIAWALAHQTFQGVRFSTPVLGILFGFILLLCIGGYLFVEVFPLRIWATAQTYRLLYIPKWLGLVLIAGWVGHLFDPGCGKEDRELRFPALLSLLSLPTMAAAFAVFLLRRWLGWRILNHRQLFLPFLWSVLVALFAGSLLLLGPEPRIYMLFAGLVLASWGLTTWSRKWLAAGMSIGLAVVAVLLLLLGKTSATPGITLADLQSDKLGVAAYVKANTLPDTVLLTPPKFGELRYTAERAIVADFKAFPFQDTAMIEWQQRLFDCYVEPIFTGWTAEKEMMIEYRRITDAEMIGLSQKYGFSYAILNQGVESGFPVLYSDENYFLIQVASVDWEE